MSDKTFSKLSDDVVLKIFFLLEDDPRSWARLSCVCNKFSSLISAVCCKSKCLSTLSTDLHAPSTSPAGAWSSLYKIAVCCPGLLHSGVLLDNSDFGLLRELGPDQNYHHTPTPTPTPTGSNSAAAADVAPSNEVDNGDTWTLYDDLYYDTIYDNSETSSESTTATAAIAVVESEGEAGGDMKKRKLAIGGEAKTRLLRAHLASGAWNLSREQGNKLLASRFREDCLYLSDWPGCVHMEEKRNYMVFRGVFKNFKRTRVWRTINDGQRSKVELNCAFCGCKDTWDLHSAFCLKRGFGFHEDGDPVVRAYVCENGHVSGAWTDFPLYS
ncbi:phytochrome A-associated F-box protein [Silene latifolia]|uniref:phytochrome A-associated F-box protein n=1 Tax=Silene latifolia TaxID=37657 RepID=UPI003D7867DF